MHYLRAEIVLLILLIYPCINWAQTRYIDEVFEEVQVTDTVTYGINKSILPLILREADSIIPVPLKMDVYEPIGDTSSARPLIIYAITGYFFPSIINGSFTGELTDSAHVAFATRMAQKGYVVAVVQYRGGWNVVGEPISQQRTILQAIYKGIQDVRTAIRYFRKTVVEDENPWKINPDKIAVGGNGTGANLAYGATYLKDFEQLLLPKFIDERDANNPEPFVDTLIWGDIDGVRPAKYNIPNYPTYNSDFSVGFAMGGVLVDSSWVDRGDIPFVSVHTWKDPIAPPRVGDVIALNPNTNEPFAIIPNASGGYGTIDRSTLLGNQDIFNDVNWWSEPFSEKVGIISTRVEENNEGNKGLYPFVTPYTPGDAMCLGAGVPSDTLTQWSSPWTWFDPDSAESLWNSYCRTLWDGCPITGEQMVCRDTRGAPNDPISAKAYTDTAITFIASRIGVVMDLFEFRTVGVEDYFEDRNIEVFPNPTQNIVTVNNKGAAKPIQEIALMDYTGHVIRSYQVNATTLTIRRDGLASGMYLLRVKVDDRFITKQVMFD